MTNTFEILATAFGLVQGVLAMLNKRVNWVVYVIQLVFLILFSYESHLYGDMWQSVVMIGICAYAFVTWGKPESKVTTLSSYHRIDLVGITAFAWVVVAMILQKTNDPLPGFDSFTTVTTFVALGLMAERKLEAWVVWFVNDVVYIVEYAMLPDQALYLLGLYVIWTAMAVLTFYTWHKDYKKGLINETN